MSLFYRVSAADIFKKMHPISSSEPCSSAYKPSALLVLYLYVQYTAPQPVAPKPTAPQPVAPKPIAPQPVAPKPTAVPHYCSSAYWSSANRKLFFTNYQSATSLRRLLLMTTIFIQVHLSQLLLDINFTS